MYYQRTLKDSVNCAGIGLHSGKKVNLTLSPAPEDSGIIFKRKDLGGIEIPAKVGKVGRVDFATSLTAEGQEIKTVEHLLSALYGMGVDNALVEIDSAEVPIMDGSAASFVFLIKEAGVVNQTRSRRYLKVVKPMEVSEEGRWIKVLPCEDLRVTYTIAFPHPIIRQQTLTIPINEATFEDQVAPARTFGFMKDIERLRIKGLTLGGSVDNAVVLSETGVMNRHLRFQNEFVRHKILDFLGDIALAGFPLKAHIIVHKGGHRLHVQLAKLLKVSLGMNRVESPSDELQELSAFT